MTIHLNIGSNIGHRHSAIERAVAALSVALPGRIAVSDPIETPPWGFESPNPFVNVGVRIDMASDLAPADVLEAVMAVQRSISPLSHRDATGGYCDRLIDIDIIAIDDIVLDTPDLTLPHPRMHLRDFVLIPLAALAPDWRHPLLHKTPATLHHEIQLPTNPS